MQKTNYKMFFVFLLEKKPGFPDKNTIIDRSEETGNNVLIIIMLMIRAITR